MELAGKGIKKKKKKKKKTKRRTEGEVDDTVKKISFVCF